MIPIVFTLDEAREFFLTHSSGSCKCSQGGREKVVDCLASAEEFFGAPDPFDADKINLDNWDGFQQVRKRPVVVHACQMNLPEGFKVTTPEGVVTGKQGDYLMVGVEGEKYPCRKDIFEATYDVVE